MDILFVLYVGLIPAVPLFGANIYRRRSDKVRRNVCYGLFALQLLMSTAYIIAWFRAH